MNAADRRRLGPALGVVAVLLALLLIALWAGLGRGARWQDHAAPASLPPAGDALPAPAGPPPDQYTAGRQHPLFSPTHTPPPPPPGDAAARAPPQPTRVIMLPHLKMAILHDKASGRDYRVVEGQPPRDGPVLVELHPRSAVVEASGSRVQLQLIPGPAPEADNAPEPPEAGQPVPMQDQGPGSAMVSRPGVRNPQQASGPDSAEARARALKARIEAERRRARQRDGGQ